jgi:hypothetical protein
MTAAGSEFGGEGGDNSVTSLLFIVIVIKHQLDRRALFYMRKNIGQGIRDAIRIRQVATHGTCRILM